jgi:hypothetical protein
MCGKVCNIREPGTGPEIGYSIRMLVAMALRGMDTGRPDSSIRLCSPIRS